MVVVVMVADMEVMVDMEAVVVVDTEVMVGMVDTEVVVVVNTEVMADIVDTEDMVTIFAIPRSASSKHNTTFILKYKGDSFQCSFSWI
jgi:hypothetical protein